MNIHKIIKNKSAQTAIEYLLLLMTVAAIVLVGFRTYLPSIQETSDIYYNRAVPGILGAPPKCGDGTCEFHYENCCNCPSDCLPCTACAECICQGNEECLAACAP